MANDVQHTITLADIRKIDGMDNHTRASITPLFAELAAAVLIHDDTEKKRVRIGGMVDDAEIDYREESTSGNLVVSWYFGRTFRRMAQDSNHWAILDRQAVFHLGSKYSVLLFQHIASLQNLKHKTSKRFTVSELRAVLGIPDGKLTRFSNFNTWAIKAAVEEINSDLTRQHLTVKYHKIGRTVAEVEIAWKVNHRLPCLWKREQHPALGSDRTG